jgi:hypothetical protein
VWHGGPSVFLIQKISHQNGHILRVFFKSISLPIH